ncbi:MAG: DUF1009 domain-containing protein, partial [Desulfovibrionales bacterium]
MSSPQTPPVGIIAGKGQFPFLVAKGAADLGHAVYAVGFSGHTSPELSIGVTGFTMLRLGQLE